MTEILNNCGALTLITPIITPRIDVRSRRIEDARSEVNVTLISDSKSGYLSYVLLVIGQHIVYGKLTKTL